MIFIDKPTNKRFVDREGEKFNNLLIIGYAGKKYTNHYWWCKCDCGNIKKIQINSLRSNNTKSCGCNKIYISSTIMTKHGMFGTSEYNSYISAKDRCNNINSSDYKNYGKRGIKFLFNSFEEFYSELGDKPEPKKNYSIERIDNNGHYEIGNCKWDISKNQCRNKRNNHLIFFQNKMATLQEWSEIININRHTISKRINKYNWCIECSLTILPCKSNSRKNNKGCKHKK